MLNLPTTKYIIMFSSIRRVYEFRYNKRSLDKISFPFLEILNKHFSDSFFHSCQRIYFKKGKIYKIKIIFHVLL